MGLITWPRIGLLTVFALLSTWTACVQEIPLAGPEQAKAYLFVDGGLERGESFHTLTLGRTRGPGASSFTAIDDATVEVEDVASGERSTFNNFSRGRYSLAEFPVGDRAYRLRVATTDGRTFVSAADSLVGDGPALTYRPALIRRFFPSGDSGVVGAGVRMNFALPGEPSDGLVLIDHSSAFRLSDIICGGLDGALSCYVQDTPVIGRLQFVEIGDFTPGTTVVRDVGVLPIDWRFGELVVVAINVSRYSAGAREYFNAVGAALRTQEGFFAAKPLTPAGNLVETTEGREDPAPVLGYFGVREREAYYVPLTTPEIRALAPPPACAVGAINVPDVVDCCACFVWERAKLERPSWFPG